MAAALLSAGLLFPFHPFERSQPASYVFEATASSDSPGYIQLFYDIGRGFNESDSRIQNLQPDGVRRLIMLPLPLGRYSALRLDPLNGPGVVTISGCRIRDRQGRVLLEIPPERILATQQIQRISISGQTVRMDISPGCYDPNTLIKLDGPFILASEAPTDWAAYAKRSAAVFSALLLAVALIRKGPRQMAALLAFSRRRPRTALAAIALAGVMLNSFPVIFCGRSYVSPNDGVVLLYDGFPTLPGYENTDQDDPKGSDVGAMMWWHLPASNVEREAVLKDHELPLWNRYDLCGQPLFGQGQSMIGDPLHWATAILGGGNAWAWDLKYLAAKWLFAFGIGLIVLLLTDSLAVAALLAVSSLFIGFFSFRLNHPAFVTVCYSPWILYAWLRVIRSKGRAATAGWVAALVAFDWIEMNSGTVKEAWTLIIGLSFAGALVLLLSRIPWSIQRGKWAALLWGNLLLVVISAPLWVTFLDSLRACFTSYDVPTVKQLPLTQVLGLFEDLFYRQGDPNELHVAPSANFLVLCGLLWVVASWRRGSDNRTVFSLGIAAVVPFLLAYGLIPAKAILAVPILRNFAHIDTTFSSLLIVLSFPMAGLGLKGFLAEAASDGYRRRACAALAMLALVALLYFWGASPTFVSSFFRGYIPCLFAAVVLLFAVAPRLVRWGRESSCAALLALLALFGMHWRHGQYLSTAFDPYVVNPQVRVNLNARSPAINYIQAHQLSPSRAIGLGLSLFPGFNQQYLVEDIYGADALRTREYEELATSLGLFRVIAFTTRDPNERSAARRAAYDALNVEYFVGSPDVTDPVPDGWGKVATLDLAVFRSSTVWPRAFFVDAVGRYREAADFAKLVARADGEPLAAIQDRDLSQLPEVARLPLNGGPSKVAAARNFTLTTNRTSFEVTATGPGVAVLLESWLSGDFRATVNGQRVQYFRINHAFKGVYLPSAGTYRISFEYWPRHLTLSLWLAAGTLGLYVAFLGWAWRSNDRSTPPSLDNETV